MEHSCSKETAIDDISHKIDNLNERMGRGDVMFQRIDDKLSVVSKSLVDIERKVDYTNGTVKKHCDNFLIMKWCSIVATAVFVFMLTANELGWFEALVKYGGK